MPVKDKTVSVYPDPKAVRAVGGYRCGLLNQAIECWAKLLRDATHDNEAYFTRQEWTILADAVGSITLNPAMPSPGVRLAEAVDGYSIGFPDKRPVELQNKLESLDYVHAWAVVWAVKFLQANDEDINPSKDSWWTNHFRNVFLA